MAFAIGIAFDIRIAFDVVVNDVFVVELHRMISYSVSRCHRGIAAVKTVRGFRELLLLSGKEFASPDDDTADQNASSRPNASHPGVLHGLAGVVGEVKPLSIDVTISFPRKDGAQAALHDRRQVLLSRTM